MSKPVLTLEAFAEFCESKPVDEEFDICRPLTCLRAVSQP